MTISFPILPLLYLWASLCETDVLSALRFFFIFFLLFPFFNSYFFLPSLFFFYHLYLLV
jgi:hypothetical protein